MGSTAQLRVVDGATGELRPVPNLQALEDEIEGLQTTIRSQAATIGNLRRELRPEEDHELFPTAKRLHDFWRERCKHPRSKFTPDRFREVLPRLREHGEEMCRRAIEGAGFDPFVTQRKNGSTKRHDGWTLVMRSDKFEEFANRAPYHLPDPKHVATLAGALRFLYPDRETAWAVEEAQRRLKARRR